MNNSLPERWGRREIDSFKNINLTKNVDCQSVGMCVGVFIDVELGALCGFPTHVSGSSAGDFYNMWTAGDCPGVGTAGQGKRAEICLVFDRWVWDVLPDVKLDRKLELKICDKFQLRNAKLR